MNVTIGGIDARKWINRMIRSRSQSHGGRSGHGIPAKLIALQSGGSRAIIIPVGHGHPEVVDTKVLRPWWSRNPDLKRQ